MPDRFILDPSMLLHGPTLSLLGEFARDGGGMVLPATFLSLVDEPRDPQVLRAFSPDVDAVSPYDALTFLAANRGAFEPFSADPDGSNYYRALVEQVDSTLVAQILLEEWQFIQTESLLFARLRWPIDKLVAAGATGLALSKHQAERLIRRTLKLSNEASISTNETLRAAAKWVALGGAAPALMFGPGAAALVGVVGRVFLFYDP